MDKSILMDCHKFYIMCGMAPWDIRKQDRLYILHCALLNSIQITNKFIQYQKLCLVSWFFVNTFALCEHSWNHWAFSSIHTFKTLWPCARESGWICRKSKTSTGKSSYTDFANELVGELCSKLCWFRWHLHVSACQYSAKFQVDVKEGGGGGVWLKRPIDVKRGKNEYVDGS